MKHRPLGKLGATAAVALSLIAGAAVAEGPNRDGKVNIITNYRNLDPLTWDYQNWTWKQNHDGLQLDHLMAGDLDKGPLGTNEFSFVAQAYIPPEVTRGEIAESWEVKQDPLRIEFNLRTGVMWPAKEGVMEKREIVAEDIKIHFDTMWTSERKIPTFWDFIDEWKVEGTHKITAYLSYYNANWPYRIAWGYYDAILPPEWHALEPEQRADWKNATGSGPYTIADVRKSSHLDFLPNADYWDTTTVNGKEEQLPLNGGLRYMIIKDEAKAIASLRTGDADVMESIRWQFAEELKRSAPDLIMKEYGATNGTYIALRHDRKPFDDVRVRRAMNLAVNQREILDAVLNGNGVLLNYPFSARWTSLYKPVDQLKPSGQELFDYDVEKAKALLAEAGYPDGFEFEMQVTNTSPYHLDLVPLLEAYYARIGVKMKARIMEYPAYRSVMRKDEQAEAYLLNNGEGNPFSVLRKSYLTGQTWNPAFHSDEKFDAMYKEALSETDEAKQAEMLMAMNEYIIEDRVPQVWLPSENLYRAWWPWVKNYAGEMRVGAVRPGPIYARMWIDEAMKKEMGY